MQDYWEGHPMTVSEVAEKFKCYVMAGYGDKEVKFSGRTIEGMHSHKDYVEIKLNRIKKSK